MTKMRPPKIPEKPVPVLGSGNDFRNRRECAIIRLFLDTGMRLDDMSGLRNSADDPEFSDVHLTSRVARITSKGGHELVLPIGPKTGRERHIRARAAHPRAAEPWLWLGKKGRLTPSGIYQMIKDRSSAVQFSDLTWPMIRDSQLVHSHCA